MALHNQFLLHHSYNSSIKKRFKFPKDIINYQKKILLAQIYTLL